MDTPVHARRTRGGARQEILRPCRTPTCDDSPAAAPPRLCRTFQRALQPITMASLPGHVGVATAAGASCARVDRRGRRRPSSANAGANPGATVAERSMLTREDALDLFARRRDAWLASDLDAYLALFAPDMTFQ